MSDEQTGTSEPTTPDPEEASPPVDASEVLAPTAASAAAAPWPAPPPVRFWDRPSRRTLLVLTAVFAIWAITATAFALTGHHRGRFGLDRGAIIGRRFDGMFGDGNRMGGGGMMNGSGMMNGGHGFWISCPNGVYPGVTPPQGANPSSPPAAPSASPVINPGQGTPIGPGMNCWINFPGGWNG